MFQYVGRVGEVRKTVDELNAKDDGYEYVEMTLDEFANSHPLEERQGIYNKYRIAINFHFMVSGSTIKDAYDVVKAMKTDPRLVGNVNAIVFLSLKQKGRGVKHEYVTQEQYKELVDYCLENDVPFGFDSCSAPSFVAAVKGHEKYELFREMSEECESTTFSSYIDVEGKFYPCSFTADWKEGGWAEEEGLDVLACNDFITDIWNHPKTTAFRDVLVGNKDENGCRNCPVFSVCSVDMRKVWVDDHFIAAPKELEMIQITEVK